MRPSLSRLGLHAVRGLNIAKNGVAPSLSLSLRRSLSTLTDIDAVKKRLADKSSPKHNVAESIVEKVGRNLHLQRHHPLNIIKKRIENYCNNYAQKAGQTPFALYDSLSPIVDTQSCFDDLRVESTHVSRSSTDTYYLDENTVMRTHTSAHQTQFIAQGVPAFLCTGDVYRRDEIDASHYPVFHQMEGVRIFDPRSPVMQGKCKEEQLKLIEDDLKGILTGLARHLFGDVELRWREDYFPFTTPSFELEVFFNGDWLEVLGCGVIHPEVLTNSIKKQREQFPNAPLSEDITGWAFGLGLERLAMVLFSIPDIRLFWSQDPRFLTQFNENNALNTVFVPYSKYPMCYKDVSFWLPAVAEGERGVHVNDVYELIRNVAGDLVEKVTLFDTFTHPKTGRSSHAYRIEYRHMDRSLTNKEVDEVQLQVREQLVKLLKVQLR